MILIAGCSGAHSREAGAPVLPLAPPGAEEKFLFTQWLKEFRVDALKAGISAEVFDRATKRIEIDQAVIKADGDQPEFTRPVWEYLGSAVNQKRIARGRTLLAENASLLGQIEQRYGVDRHVLVAIWGLESNFGDLMGTRNVVQSLATLGFEGRRPDFGRTQLLAALRILQAGDIEPERMLGSWAGAMGQTQFMPTTYLEHAVDFDGNGKRDIWHSTGDALGSAAHYLKVSGWKTGQTWGREASLPKGFDYRLAEMDIFKSVAEWEALGVRAADGMSFSPSEKAGQAAILLPAGHKGPAFLSYDNFKAILAYNRSTSYVLAVGLLADSLRGGGTVRASWPLDERPLSRSERVELQERLTARGYEHGKPDGIVGFGTRKAIRLYQANKGLVPDGYATSSLLAHLRKR